MKIICPKHDPIIPLKACCHILEQIQICGYIAKQDFKTLCIRYEWMTLEDDKPKSKDAINCFNSHVFCKNCIEKYGLPVDIPISSDDIDGKYQKAFEEVGVICPKCFSDFSQR
ncbi:hypothetical protein [Candidatus Albibeggiatoa sp. nov. BB20]|uniref:hypothetical protein n=1 Tax=Candidatus Albibeggiatoa sp. nov. BB20 TaxID=3162723 RepID=UPI0033659963